MRPLGPRQMGAKAAGVGLIGTRKIETQARMSFLKRTSLWRLQPILTC